MRLICPNCATQYEVDDSAVPAAGREVQCGSCASTWFQAPARSNVSSDKEKSGDLPEWVEDIVEDDAHEEAAELPGQAPAISSAPNEDIVSEPELEGLIDTGDLAAGIDTGAAKSPAPASTSAEKTAKPQEKIAEPEQGKPDAPVLDQTTPKAHQKTPDEPSPAQAEVAQGETQGDDLEAASLAKTASQAAVAATIAANMSGSASRPESAEAAETPEFNEAKTDFPAETPVSEPVSPEPVAEATQAPDPLQEIAEDLAKAKAAVSQPEDASLENTSDVSTELETAIRERTSATKEDFPAIAAAELEASKAAEIEAKAAADAAIKSAEQAAALKVAEEAAALKVAEAEAAKSIDSSPQADPAPLEPLKPEAKSPPIEDAPVEQPSSAAALETAATTAQAAASEVVAEATSEAKGEVAQKTDEETTDAIAAEIQNALEDLEAGKPVPQNPSEEKLSDYDLTESHDIPEEFAAVLPDEASGPIQGPTESFNPEDITVEKPDMTAPTLVSTDQTTGALDEKISKTEQTETLAAKLKARVAEAAKAQATTASAGTAGVVLGASAAGIAAAGGGRTTAFPKRDTEELTSSLRPKSLDGGSIKPRLRPAATPEPRKSRFGQGFMLAIAIFVVALLLYLFRDPIVTAIPALDPALTSYASVIDNVRLIFQDAIGKLTGSVTGETQS